MNIWSTICLYAALWKTPVTQKRETQVGKNAVQKTVICYDAFSIYNLLCTIITTETSSEWRLVLAWSEADQQYSQCVICSVL